MLADSMLQILERHSQHGHKMSRSSEQNKDVPDFMKAKHAGFEVEDLGGVDHCAKRVHHAADDKPDKYPGGECGKQLPAGSDTEPAHENVNAGIQPARRANIENLHHDPDDRQRPDNAQHTPLPKAGEGVHAERGVGACDQKENGSVVNFAEDFQHFIFCAHHVISGAGREHGDQAETVNGQ